MSGIVPFRPGWSRDAALALVAILLLAVALRVIGIDYALWNDEVASTKFAAAPVHLLWSDWMVRETNPPLYYTLLEGWWAIFGGSDVALRMMSVVFGCVGVVLVFLLGRHVGGLRAAIIAGALVAASAQNIMYSQQVRGYILGYAAAAAAILAALTLLARVQSGADGKRGGVLIGYAAAVTVALYAHTTFILLPALVGVFVLGRLLVMRERGWRPVLEWIGTNAVVLLLWAWWAHITLLQAQSRATIGWINTPSLPYAVRMSLESYVPWQFGPLQLVVAALAIAAAGFATWRWRNQPNLLLLPFLAVAAPVLLYLISLKVPVFLNRTVYWASAPFLVTVAAGIAALRRPWAGGAVAIAAVASIAGLLAWYPTREIEPWRAIVAAIQRQEPGATVLVAGKGPALALRRYCRWPSCTLRIVGLSSPSTDTWASGFAVPDMIDPSAAPALTRRGNVVVVRWMSQDPIALMGASNEATTLPVPAGRGNIGVSVLRQR